MAWRDNLVPASFRGVAFHVLSHDYAVGRRNVLHQYPFKDEPYIEDLGADTDEFSIEGYIVANASNEMDYFTQRNSLIAALKKADNGKLIHPYLGEQNVSLIGKARIREVFSEGGIARFSMTFAYAGKREFPKEDIDPSGVIDEKTKKAVDDALDAFYDQYNINLPTNSNTQSGNRALNQSKVIPYAVTQTIDDFATYVSLAKSQVNKIRNTSGGSLEYVKSVLDDARSTLIEIAHYPCQIAGLVLDCVDSILELANVVGTGYLGQILGKCSGQIIKRKLSSSGDSVDAELGKTMTISLLSVVGESSSTGFGSESNNAASTAGSLVPLAVTTVASARIASNRLSFVNMIKVVHLIGAVRVAIRIDFKNISQVEFIKQAIIDSMDFLLEKLGNESASDPYKNFGVYIDNRNLYSQIESLRGAFLSGIKEKYYNLPGEVQIDPASDGITALELAYNQYEDISRVEEIFVRNQPTLKHPGFILDSIRILSI